MKLNIRPAQMFAFAIVTLFASHPARAATDANRSVFEAIYKASAKALKDRDLKTINSYEAEDFSLKTIDGKSMNREQANASLEKSLAIFKTISKADEEITEIKIENDTATLQVTEKMSATTIADPQGKEHSVESTTKSRDIWIKKGDKWLIKYSEVLEDTSTLDGKPMK